MLYRIPAIHIMFAAMLLALAGCGGNSASLTAAMLAGSAEGTDRSPLSH